MNHYSLAPNLVTSLKRLGSNKAKVWIEAYGCSASVADSEMISGLLKSGGYELARSEGESDVNLIVTCSVKDKTEHRMRSRITKLAKTGKALVIAGCLPKADQRLVTALAPSASLLGPHSIDKAPQVTSASLNGQRLVAIEDSVTDKINIPRIRVNPTISVVEIASGCQSECSFCQTKLAKGWLRSYRPSDILAQIKHDLQDGCKEIWLTSTDNGCYGYDIGIDLSYLLQECTSVKGDFVIRVGMMNPMYLPKMIQRLIPILSHPIFYKFLHIPVQSGSDKVLGDMRRGHTSKIFSNTSAALRATNPKFCIATDVIVGFPTETDEDFQMTLELLKKCEPDVTNISRYSSRPGTAAAKMKKLGTEILKVRSEKAHSVAREIARKRNSLWSAWEGEITIEEKDMNGIRGRNFAYKPVQVSGTETKTFDVGQKINVRITGFSSYTLKGEII